MLKRKNSSTSAKPSLKSPKTSFRAEGLTQPKPEPKVVKVIEAVKEEVLAPAESLTPQEMNEELRELQLLTVSEDQTGLTKARLRRAIKIVYLLNQSKTGPKEKTPRKGKTKEGPINLDTLPEGADPYDTL